MKRLLPLTIGLFFGFVLLITYAPVWGSGKIEPTRTLKGTDGEMGKLSVFSDPPGLHVTLDGSEIGKTPVRAVEIQSGSHILRISESETEIYIIPGEPMNLSWRKGSFIEISAPKSSEQAQPQAEDKSQQKKKKAADPQKKEPELEPLYWPLNPKGPIF
jgi:hypothetical protein